MAEKRREMMVRYNDLWMALGLDLDTHEKLLKALPPTYYEVYFKQENRPRGMEYFDFVINEIPGLRIKELQEFRQAGGKVVGTFCLYVPEELILAAGGVFVGLCAGIEVGTARAESVLPRNICPLIKSFMGFKLQVEKDLRNLNLPVLKIETDYSEHNAGQLRTRIEAFIEMLTDGVNTRAD
ncbi:2-hydroxyacyl-CoA dehydratase [Thermodesulfitimonas sp.]